MDKIEPCPWCDSADHCSVQSVGVMTNDMPDRPYRVICTDIGHDTITGPVAYGRYASIAAWNKRPAQHDAGEGADLMERAASIMRNCHIETGVCCCGDPMGERHASPMNCGHSPCDSGAYQASLWLDDFSAMKGPNNE